MSENFFLGIDIGSSSTKAVLLDSQQKMVGAAVSETHPNHKISAEMIVAALLADASQTLNRQIDASSIAYCVGTGYGRNNITLANQVFTEIACHARGVHFCFPLAKTVIDIGGQDSKVIGLTDEGGVRTFALNEKCAAGTGRFLEMISAVLEVGIAELGPLSRQTSEEVKISSMCTVFAESEVISKLAEGAAREAIMRGLHSAIVFRVLTLGKRVGIMPPLVFTGGVARNIGVVDALAAQTGLAAIGIPARPEITGALGAALLAFEAYGQAGSKISLPPTFAPEPIFPRTLWQAQSNRRSEHPRIGWTDLAAPLEILMAAGIDNVRIRGDMDKGASSDKYIQTYSCAYIKNAVSALMEKSEEYRYLDGILMTNCCTATDKMADILHYHKDFQNLTILSLTIPRNADEHAVAYLRRNLWHIKETLEVRFERSIGESEVRQACQQSNQIKSLLLDYSRTMAAKNIPDAAWRSALELERLWRLEETHQDYITGLTSKIKRLHDSPPEPKRGPNILLAGSIIPDLDFYHIFQAIPCQLAYNLTSSGNKFAHALVDLTAADIYEAIARRCLYPGYGPRMTDSAARIALLETIIHDYEIDAVIFNITKFCVYYTFESVLVKSYCDQRQIPFLAFETDFSNKSVGRLRTQIEAFMESLGQR